MKNFVTEDKIVKAIIENKGNLSASARQLGLSRDVIRTAKKNSLEIKNAIQKMRQMHGKIVVSKKCTDDQIMQAIKDCQGVMHLMVKQTGITDKALLSRIKKSEVLKSARDQVWGGRKECTDDQIMQAIKDCQGVMHLMVKQTGNAKSSLYRRIRKSEVLKSAWKQFYRKNKDLEEKQVIQAIYDNEGGVGKIAKQFGARQFRALRKNSPAVEEAVQNAKKQKDDKKKLKLLKQKQDKQKPRAQRLSTRNKPSPPYKPNPKSQELSTRNKPSPPYKPNPESQKLSTKNNSRFVHRPKPETYSTSSSQSISSKVHVPTKIKPNDHIGYFELDRASGVKLLYGDECQNEYTGEWTRISRFSVAYAKSSDYTRVRRPYSPPN